MSADVLNIASGKLMWFAFAMQIDAGAGNTPFARASASRVSLWMSAFGTGYLAAERQQ
jgi:hypothetical protein